VLLSQANVDGGQDTYPEYLSKKQLRMMTMSKVTGDIAGIMRMGCGLRLVTGKHLVRIKC
jgi:hypothetical protein